MTEQEKISAIEVTLRPLVEMLRTDTFWHKTDKGYRRAVGLGKFTYEQLKRHVEGNPPHGLAQIKAGESTTRVAIFDLDDHDKEMPIEEMIGTASKLYEQLESDGYKPRMFTSTGGKGVHIYVNWEKPQDAASVRKMMSSVLAKHGFSDGTKGVKLKQIEVFPKQDGVPTDGFGNMAALPLSGESKPIDPMFGYEICEKEYAIQIKWESSPDVPVIARGEFDNFGTSDQREQFKPFVVTAEDEKKLKHALNFIPNTGDRAGSLGYEDWLKVLFAVHHATDGSDTGLQIMREFSERSSKFEDEAELIKQWHYAKTNRNGGNGPITIGTLFKMSAEHGWHEPEDHTSWLEDLTSRIDEVFSNANENVIYEYDPLDLWEESASPEFKKDQMPVAVWAIADTYSKSSGLDRDGSIASLVTAYAAAVPRTVRINAKALGNDRIEAICLWTMLKGKSGSGKTPIMEYAVEPLADMSMATIVQFKKEMDDYRKIEKRSKGAKGVPDVELPPPPVEQLCYLTNSTIQKVGMILGGSTRGLMVHLDEIAPFFESSKKNASKYGVDKKDYMQMFNGKTAVITRVGRETDAIQRSALSILGGTQDSVFSDMRELNIEDGGLARFLVVNLKYKVEGNASVDTTATTRLHKDIIRRLSLIPETTLRLDPDAQKLFDESNSNYSEYTKLHDSDKSGLTEHVNKLPTMLIRIAAIFHLSEWAATQSNDLPDTFNIVPSIVSYENMSRSVDFLKTAFLHASITYNKFLDSDPVHVAMNSIAKHILDKGLSEITNRGMTRKLAAWRNMSEQLKAQVIIRLGSYAWITEDATVRQPSGKSIGTKWKVHPLVHELFADKFDFAEISAKSSLVLRKVSKPSDGVNKVYEEPAPIKTESFEDLFD